MDHCHICKSDFEDLASHILNNHPQITNLQNIEIYHNCPVCGKFFEKLWNLNTHIKIDHGGQKFHKCEKCGEQYLELSELNKHIKWVHFEDGYKFFEKYWDSNSQIEIVHGGQKYWKCETCNEKFGHLQILKTHVKTVHEGRKNLGHSSDLKRHVTKFHKKDHECKFCGMDFNWLCDLKKHIKIVHEGLKCEVCNKQFSVYADFIYHLKSAHRVTKTNIPFESEIIKNDIKQEPNNESFKNGETKN